jgi:2-hydroxychromene-2-carboxylate isomerase
MLHPSARIHFDFVDPLSYAVAHALGMGNRRDGETAASPGASRVRWVGFELHPPPAPITVSDDPIWSELRKRALTWVPALDLPPGAPRLVPWTRKAHELHLHASALGAGDAVRAAIFEAYFRHRRDIGRVDVLVEIAAASGLDRTETKAVLDVDRYEADVAAARRGAEAVGVRDVPSLSLDGRLVEGFPDLTDLGTLLADP